MRCITPRTTHATRPASPATDVDRFRHLITTALLAGAAAGLILFVVQHLTIVPLIDLAEGYEDAAAHAHSPAAHAHGDAGHMHEDSGWQPAPGLQRIGLTALTTVLSCIGFAAVLLAAMIMAGARLDWRRGLLWGLAGFACFVLAPALGLPPKPPGAAVGDLHARQLWWFGTVAATAIGLSLICRPSGLRWLGAVLLLVPHLLGAPPPIGEDLVPRDLMLRFAALSVATNLLFWMVLGAICGWFQGRNQPI